MDEDIKVSIICFAYNHEKYIKKTLEGFVNQKTNFRYKIIIHDDASTDGTASIIKEFENKYPELFDCIFQTDNQYSKKIDISKQWILPKLVGEYFALCEGDDYWCDENKLQKQYDLMKKNPHCAMCTHRVACCNEDGSSNSRVIPEDYYNIKGSKVFTEKEVAGLVWGDYGYPFHTSSFFMKSEYYDSSIYSWTPNWRDIDCLKLASLNGGIVYLDEILSVRRLESIGNWNSRMKDRGQIAWIELMKQDIVADELFDKISGFVYHDLINYTIFRKCFNIIEYDFSFVSKRSDVIKSVSVSHQSWKYKLFSIFPMSVWLIKKLKRKIFFLKGKQHER